MMARVNAARFVRLNRAQTGRLSAMNGTGRRQRQIRRALRSYQQASTRRLMTWCYRWQNVPLRERRNRARAIRRAGDQVAARAGRDE